MSAAPIDEKAVFNAVRRIGDPGARDDYLRRACGEDAGALQRVRDLLRVHELEASFLESPAAGAFASAPAERPLEAVGARIGPYRLLEQIGEGGFGVVFMAEQLEPVRRRVALKVIKPGMDTRQVIARFEAERQALALMDHPHIAKVLDAGATEAGRPYFVMELVRGVPITEYCDARRLTPRERLELFVAACQAVQHAHQKGIVHRDIKPSNVLVTLHDDRPVVKVIDFGIAKATRGSLTDKTLFTGFAQMVGTPLYMSPEQASMSGLDVDTRTDIYSLGVLLYELLTGATPFDSSRLREAAFDEIRRIVCEEEPARPSTRLGTSGSLPALAASRSTEPARLTRLVRGELDWIVMKALEKDRNRRYETASGLALDVQRHLADGPVSACPPSAGYRLRKFARRHRRALATAALVGAALLVAAGSLGWMARAGAARRGRNAEAVATLLDQCDAALAADAGDPAAIALGEAERRAADGGAEDLAGRLARCRADLALLRELDAIDTYDSTWSGTGPPSPPAVAARWRAALEAYGLRPSEDPAGETARRIARSLLRDRVVNALDRWLAAEPSPGVREALRSADPDAFRDEVRDAVVARDLPKVGALLERPVALAQPSRFATVLGRFHAGPPERRRAVMESALRARPGDLGLLMELGNSYLLGPERRSPDPQGVGERVRWCQAAVAAHPRNVAALNNLGNALADRGDDAGAIACFRDAVGIDPTFARGHYNLGVVLAETGKPREAEAAYRDALRHDPNEANAHLNLALLLLDDGKPVDAIPHLEAALRIAPGASAHYNLGNALRSTGHVEDALLEFRRAIDAQSDFAEAHCNLGRVLQSLGRFSEALEALREGDALGRRRPDWRYPSEAWVRECERLLALQTDLPQVLAGRPASAAEHLQFAGFCLLTHRPEDAVLLYGKALAADPGVLEGGDDHPRYDAARAAALAAAGHGASGEASRGAGARLRAQALEWLEAELADRRRVLAREPTSAASLEDELRRWLDDPDLARVRDAQGLETLPEAERQRWSRFWGEVRAIRARAATSAK